MGTISTTKNDEVSPYIDDILSSIFQKTNQFLDDVADVYKESEQQFAPIGETQNLHDAIGVDTIDEHTRYIYSVIFYNEWVVGGHATMVTPEQRAWWFWFLHTELGGVYERKTEGEPGTAGPNDYVLEAYDSADSDVDARSLQYLDDVFGN